MLIRLSDIVLSLLGLLFLLPIFLILAVWIKFDSQGSIFFRQIRVGKDGRDFRIYKFRTMIVNAEKMGIITIGERELPIQDIFSASINWMNFLSSSMY